MSCGLEKLSSDDFQVAFGVVATAEALYRALQRSPAVQAVREALRSEQLNDDEIRVFVAELLQAWTPSYLFPNDVALAGIATALESRCTDFADEYLHDLARLNSSELPKSTRIARLCLKSRSASSSSTSNKFFMVEPSRVPRLDWRRITLTEEKDAEQLTQRFDARALLCQN